MCGITYQTVRHHLQAIRLKLSARNTTHAVLLTLTGRVLGISAMIGLLMLIGIVVTNAVLLTLTQNLILLEDGHEAEKVVGG